MDRAAVAVPRGRVLLLRRRVRRPDRPVRGGRGGRGQPVILGYDDRKASLLRSWLGDPGAVTFLAGSSLYATPARAIASYWRMFSDLTAAGATQIRIAGDVPHEGNGGRFAGWDR